MFLRSLIDLGDKFKEDDVKSAMDCFGFVTLMVSAQDAKRTYAAEALYKMGTVYAETQAFRRAIYVFDQALAINPADRNCCLAKIDCLFKLGDIDSAIQFQDAAFREVYTRKLYLYNYSGTMHRDEISRRHREWGDAIQSFLGSPPNKYSTDRNPERVLKIGYISPDLRKNVVAFFLEAALRNRSADRLKTLLYLSGNRPPDEHSEVLKGICDEWKDVRHQQIPQVRDLGVLHTAAPFQSSARPRFSQVAEQIRRDGVDILVDLAGHTSNRRLPAPHARSLYPSPRPAQERSERRGAPPQCRR